MNERKTLRYKGVRVNAFGLPVFSKEQKNSKKVLGVRDAYHPRFLGAFKEGAPKNLIVMYDIPDALKIERDWFRRHLVKFGYVMIQRSVWVGPSPLPKDFLDYAKEIKIGDNLKTFKLAKSYNSKYQL